MKPIEQPAKRQTTSSSCNTTRQKTDDAPTFGCVIMASGLGRRFGNNKLLTDFLGAPLICRILQTTDGLFDRRIVVTRHPQIRTLCEKLSVECILHDKEYRSDTVRIGLEPMMNLSHVLFVPGDQPLLRRETLLHILDHARSTPNRIHRTIYEETPGSPILFPRWAYEELLHLPEGKGGSIVAKKYPEQIDYIPVQDPSELYDIDLPEDLPRLEQIALAMQFE